MISEHLRSKLVFEEKVYINDATYDRGKQKITFLVSHGGGCGADNNYSYNLKELDSVALSAKVDVKLLTDIRCKKLKANIPIVNAYNKFFICL